MAIELHELVENVNDEKSFLIFVQALIKDKSLENPNSVGLCGRGSRGWENQSIETFLEASHAWAESTNLGLTQGMSKDSPWKRFAAFLYCGKIYE
ncbi:MAG: hypothetical protein ACI9SP_001206 [Arenicella sp.]|jgi:hypothetical protein